MPLSPFDNLKQTHERLIKSRAHLRRGNELLAEAAQRIRPILDATRRLEAAILSTREAIELETEVIDALERSYKPDPRPTDQEGGTQLENTQTGSR